jgi:hypothetical protein
LATKPRTFHWPPSQESSIGHQAKNLPLATKPRIFYWPLSQEPSIGHQAKNLPLATKPRTLTLSLKGGLGTWELSFSFPWRKQFQSNLESVCFNKVLEEGRKDQL